MSCLPWPSEEKFLERVLRDYEDELAFSLRRVDPVELSENFFERSVISKESYNQFTSMDHSRIKSRLRLRYLVRLVSEKLKKDPALWENLLAVLDTLEGVPSSLTDKLKQAVLNTNEGLADDSEAVGGVSGTSLGEANENEEVVLTTGDVNLLTELLVEVSDVWFNIAISLGLPQHEINNCKGKDNKISLFQILGFWVANNSEPTLKKLTDTLCSEIVARTAAAKKVTRKFMEAKRMSKGNAKRTDVAKSKRHKSPIIPTTPRIVIQSLPTAEVADGKSTLLKVQASPRESVSYQWKKDDKSLANSFRYSGVDEDILVVRHACQGTEGEYTCQVSLQDKQVSSEPITLTVLFPLAAKRRLLNLYSTVSEIPSTKSSWPPFVAKSFINLALIKSSRAQEITGDYSVHDDADDIIAEKEIITYKDVFSEYKSGELILVEGRPGSGKTTLVHKIIKDWRLGEVLTKSELTFLVTLRLLNNMTLDESLGEILQEFYSNNEELETTVSTIIKKDGDGVCFVLDGLDEYCSRNKEKSVILKLLNRKLLPRSMIIVFSRPSATRLINRDCIAKHIEVFGFRKEQISEYIDNFPFEIEDSSSGNSIIKANQLKEYLHSHPNIHDMCYLPIHAAMICFLFQLSNNMSPTQTRVYEEFTLSIVYRLFASRENSQALNSLKDLKGAHAQYFNDLCRLAYEMTIESKQVISSQQLEKCLGERGSLSEEAGLGLLTICPTLQKTGIHQNYAFLHLTFQEFLAAYYIANYLDESQQIELLVERCRNKRKVFNFTRDMKTVWRFYSGLVNFENSEQILYNLLASARDIDSEFFHYALESQQKCVCDAVMMFYSQTLQFDGTTTRTLNVSDFSAIEYVVTTSSQLITDLEIANMDYSTTVSLLHKLKKADLHQLQHISILTKNIAKLSMRACLNDDGMEHFCELLNKSNNVKHLRLEVEHALLSSARELADQINRCTSLLRLDLSYNGTPECIQTFAITLNPHMPECSLSLEKLNHQGHALGHRERNRRWSRLYLKVINKDTREDLPCPLGGQKSSLKNCFSLKLKLINFDISGLACLSKKLSHKQLQRDLDQCDDHISLDGASTLVGGLKFLTALKCPDRSDNIGPNCTIVEACGIKFFTLLQCLDVSASIIDSDGIAAIAYGFQYMTRLEILYLHHINIGCNGARALACGFKYLARLNELYLCVSSIGPDGATALAAEFRHLVALQKLDLSHNNIGPDGATALAEKFRHLAAIQKLDLSHNNIGPDGATALAGKFEFLAALQKFDLSHNNIGPDGATALAGKFEFLTALQMLNLSCNKIGLYGTISLARQFNVLTALRMLDLSHNSIGPDGAIALAGGLCYLTELRQCFLYGNSITHAGAKAVITSLKECEHLEQCSL